MYKIRQIHFVQIKLFSTAQCAATGELVHSINNFVTSFSHNLFINSLLQRERGVSWGEICIQTRYDSFSVEPII